LLRVQRAQAEIIDSDLGLNGEFDSFDVIRGGLRLGAPGFNGPADTAPEIEFVAKVERHRKIIEGGRLPNGLARRRQGELGETPWRVRLPERAMLGNRPERATSIVARASSKRSTAALSCWLAAAASVSRVLSCGSVCALGIDAGGGDFTGGGLFGGGLVFITSIMAVLTPLAT